MYEELGINKELLEKVKEVEEKIKGEFDIINKIVNISIVICKGDRDDRGTYYL